MPCRQLQMTLVHASSLGREAYLTVVCADKDCPNGVKLKVVHAKQQEDILCTH